MLHVKATAGPSRIHRSGLIAQEFIPQGSRVWEFMPEFDVAITEAGLERLSPAAQEQVIYWAYFHLETRTYILSSDDDRFTNHADDPNTVVAGDCTIAARDIHLGEEITNNYSELAVLNFSTRNDYGVRSSR
jgi:uncharacterized protein